jgi:chromosome partitioning protein
MSGDIGDRLPDASKKPIKSLRCYIHPMRIIAVINRKGGTAKTTTVDNLAVCLAQKGFRILIVDLDPQGGATVQIGLDKRKLKSTIYDALVHGKPLFEIICSTPIDNVDIVPANIELDGAKEELAGKTDRGSILKMLLDQLPAASHQPYDFVIIDCEPGMNVLTLNGLLACSEVIVPMQAEYSSLEGTADLIQTTKDVEKYMDHHPQIRFLITMVVRTIHSREAIDMMHEQFKEQVFKTTIPRNISVAEAPSFGKPVVLYAPSSLGARAYQQFTEEFLNG